MVPGEAFPARTASCAPGDLLVVLTDGLIEVPGRDGRLLGLDGFERLLQDVAGRPLGEVFDRVFEGVRSFGVSPDDQTLLLMRYRGESAPG